MFQSEEKKSLTKHMEGHDDRSYSCGICKKNFVGLKAMRGHREVHEVAECVYCHKTLSRKGKNRHQESCSGRRDNS